MLINTLTLPYGYTKIETLRYGEDEGGYVVTVSFIGHPLRKETILILRKCVSCNHTQNKTTKTIPCLYLDKIKKCTTIEKK